MKKTLILFLLSFTIILQGCEEVVDVDLEVSEPRLVIAASIFLPKENPEASQFIRLTTTAPYFSEDVPPATGAEVAIIDERGRKFDFVEFEEGYYKSDEFTPQFNTVYQLEILYNGEIYTATESLVSSPEIEYIEQKDGAGFSGDNIELRAFYTDPQGVDNYYLFRFLHESLSIQIYDDEFTDGNLTFAYFSDGDLESGDVVRFEIQGISKRFYEYMFILRSQAGSGGGPFQTQPTTVRGNVVNETNPENFPFGYFRLSETGNFNYTVQ
jgi:hypothetical protein